MPGDERVQRRTKLKWVGVTALSIAILFVIGSVILSNLTPKPKRLVEPVVVDYGLNDPRFVRSLGGTLPHPIVEGNQIEHIEGGEAIYAAKLEAIEEAQHSITFEIFEFFGDTAAAAFADALAEAAQRGVRVHALLDYVGSMPAEEEHLERMQEAGVEVIRWREPAWYQLPRFNHRTHRKLMVVDGEVGFTGGANVTDSWLPDDGEPGYRDHHFRFTGPVVGNMQGAFVEVWLEASGELLHGDAYFPELEPQGELPMQMVSSKPREGMHRIRMMFKYAIAAAQERITISSAYFYPDPSFLEALIEAAERGVEVRILVPGDSIDYGFVRHASVNRWRPMLEAGVEIYEYQPAMYHAKLISIDDRWASVGSTNIDNRSFRINKEGNVNVYDEEFARFVRGLVEEDLDDAILYTIERWEERPWHKRLAGWVSSIAGAHY
jgi:cardiolipin synthase A/B